MDNRKRENFILHVMSKGFERAADSFSKLVGRPVRMTNSTSVLVRHGEEFSCVSEESGQLMVLTTQLIGDISGKSFLIFSEEETEEIFKVVGKQVNSSLSEAFMLEIDNIISASVISDLSNALNVEVYGDVPHLDQIHSDKLQDYLAADLESHNEDHYSMILCNTTFRFDHGDQIHPQFIWRISTKVFDVIPQEKLVA